MTEYPVGSRQALLQALSNVITRAPEADRGKLCSCLEEYAYRWPSSYRTMSESAGLISEMLRVLEEASDARIFKSEGDLPSRENEQ